MPPSRFQPPCRQPATPHAHRPCPALPPHNRLRPRPQRPFAPHSSSRLPSPQGHHGIATPSRPHAFSPPRTRFRVCMPVIRPRASASTVAPSVPRLLSFCARRGGEPQARAWGRGGAGRGRGDAGRQGSELTGARTAGFAAKPQRAGPRHPQQQARPCRERGGARVRSQGPAGAQRRGRARCCGGVRGWVGGWW